MKALAHSLLRIRTASNRLPRLTGRGISGLQEIPSEPSRFARTQSEESALAVWVRRRRHELAAAFHRTAPTLVILLLNFFR